MKKLLLVSILIMITSSHAFSQNQNLVLGYFDSLKRELAVHKDDTTRVLVLAELAFGSFMLDYDACLAYSREGLELARKIHFKRGEVRVLCAMAGGLAIRGDVPKSMELVFKGLEAAEEDHLPFETALCLVQISAIYWFLNDFPQAVIYGKRAKQVYETIEEDRNPGYHFRNYLNINIGMPYSDMNQLDSAMVYFQDIYRDTSDQLYRPVALSMLGDVEFKRGNQQQAFAYLYESIRLCEETGDYYTNADACKILARCFVHLQEVDSAIFYAKKGLANAQVIDYKVGVLDNTKILASQCETKDIRQSHHYLKMTIALNDELYGARKVQDLQKALAEDQERQRQSDVKRIAYENRLKQYGFLAGLGVMAFVAFFLYRNNRQKQKANTLLAQQKEKVQSTLQELRSTQSQLIQSEKMASLGELTAGIAHEIQNPLNFVNNFSDLNQELIDELKEELKKGDTKEATAIADNLKENESKINQHGKRADGIVKNMLQHSRSSTGQKEMTDVNKLVDEYTRLAYHGFRARNKDFNITLDMDLDPLSGKANLVTQDMGRVLLNLLNNAFFAVQEKAKTADQRYMPTVSVRTRSSDLDTVSIEVKDNGSGIPDAVKDKIFQPFFTTKPTGQGTGLGLSMSYDIVTKAHGGTLQVASTGGEGTIMTITLPTA